MEQNLNAQLRIFVYGSLKRGYRNHTAYCQGYESCRTAKVVGRLYRQADGYPMLVVPTESVLAVGTNDISGDIERLARFDDSASRQTSQLSECLESKAASSDWSEIRGEIYQWPAGYSESSQILTRLDRLEDFYPQDASTADRPSLYQRVIVLAQHEAGVEPVWTFVAPPGELPPGCTPMGLSWP